MSISIKSNAMGTQHSLHLGRRIKPSQDSTLRMSSGIRIVNPYDDAGELSVSSKVNSSAQAGTHIGHQMLNSLSFLNTQKSLLENVSSIVSKVLDLRTAYNNSFMTERDKGGYDEAFRELQKELTQISRQKFNGISIFSDQMPKNLFDESLGLEKIYQQSDALNSNDSIEITRWGIYRNLSLHLDGTDPLPKDFGEDAARDLLAFAISDESEGSFSYYNKFNFESGKERFLNDIESWIDFVGDQSTNLDAKIALIRAEDGGIFGDKLLPPDLEMPGFAKLFEVLPRDGGSVDDPTKVANGIDLLKNAFMEMTEGGTRLPRGLGVFVDDTGSLRYELVDGAVQGFVQWVRDSYPEVSVHPVTKNEGNWKDGIYKIANEQWIEQSINAVKDMLADPSFPVNDGSLDSDKTGVKGLLDNTYSLNDFSIDELEVFLERVSDALAQNGAETQAAQFAIDEIASLSAFRSHAASRSIDTDYSIESTRLIKNQFLIEGGAALLTKFKDLNATALTVLGA